MDQQRDSEVNYDKDDQSPRQLDIAADGDVDDDDEEEGDAQWPNAEGDDENGDSGRQPTPPQFHGDKVMRGLPPPPGDQRRAMIRVNHRKRPIQLETETTPGKKRRPTVKRNVRRSTSSSGESNDVVLQEEVEYKGLDITNEEEVNTFFETRLRQMQQLVCKVVAKCWIKVIEPKKQSNFPYNRGEESKPSWWPANARHKEPDHLMKPGMIFNLAHA